MIKFLKNLLSLYNKKLVNSIGFNSDLFCRIDKRDKILKSILAMIV